jgi:hypothetical protein
MRILHPNFGDCSALAESLSQQDAAIFCLDAYTGAASHADPLPRPSPSDCHFRLQLGLDLARVLIQHHAVTAGVGEDIGPVDSTVPRLAEHQPGRLAGLHALSHAVALSDRVGGRNHTIVEGAQCVADPSAVGRDCSGGDAVLLQYAQPLNT